MKVKVKLSDFNDACIKDPRYNGYVEVEAEPIEEVKDNIFIDGVLYERVATKEETPIPEWEKRFHELSDKHKMAISIQVINGHWNGHECVISFIRNLLKELVTELFHSPTTAEAWKRIYKKYGIED